MTGSTKTAAQMQSVAKQAYTYGLQQVIFYGQRWIYTQNQAKDNLSYSGVNRLFCSTRPCCPT